jgi:membrane associated rhomboid family serine protease
VLIPLRHERMEGRRWPYFTFAFIALNIVIFLFTHWTIEDQLAQQSTTRIHLVLLAATHPELQPAPEAAEFIAKLKKSVGTDWNQISSTKRPAHDSWESVIRQSDDHDHLQDEMDKLSADFANEQNASLLEKYAFIPDHPHALAYITANFLHGGWLHLIGNLWFLWLAGFILEDTWGRVIYPLFYLIAGAAALQFYAWCAPGSLMPLIGASGAVAGLMGAFLVRFPKLKIQMVFFAFFMRYKFQAPAYWLLPLWLLLEFFYGSALGTASPVAHWAHVGGFLFGMAGAFAIQRSGLEQKANQTIESKIGWSTSPDIVQANELISQGKLDEAASQINKYLASHPPTFEALNLLQQVYWRRGDRPSYFKTMTRLCEFQWKAHDFDGAWQSFEEFSNAGGDSLPPAIWLELCRIAESKEDYSRAVEEYEKLAKAYPADRASLLALLAAGRLSLKKLNRPSDALRCYEAAANSPVPHLDWNTNIRAGIEDARRASLSSV